MRHLGPSAVFLPPKIVTDMTFNDLSIRSNTLNMRQLEFNIIFQPPKEATSDLVTIKSVASIRGNTVASTVCRETNSGLAAIGAC